VAGDKGVSTSPTLLRNLVNPRNDETAWRTFVERYQPLIQRWCRWDGLNHDQAEEVCAAVLAKLVTALRTTYTYDPARRFRGWLRVVVANHVITFRRVIAAHPGGVASGDPEDHRRLQELPDAVDPDPLEDELEGVLGQAEQAVARVRRRVAERTWQAFWRTAIDREPARDVAQGLGMTVASVYVAKNRVGRFLREEGERLMHGAEGSAP
jgi:RNA polymerase sigma-70 factor (ECF subfamily)